MYKSQITKWPFVFITLLQLVCQANNIAARPSLNQPPVLRATDKNVNVAENSIIVTKLTASDPEGDELTFFLGTEQDESFFSIDASSGALAFKTAPNFESLTDQSKNHVYHVTVHVSDAQRAAPPFDLTVTVTDVMAEPANAAPKINVASISSLVILENSTEVTQIKATDPDAEAGGLTFTLSGVDAAWFSLNKTSGQLSFQTAPDAEKPDDTGTDNTYDLIVRVSDDEMTSAENFSVTVQSVDEPPVIANAMKIDENTNSLLTPVATDPENDGLKFVVVAGVDSPDAAAVELNPDTGILTFINAPDYESPADVGKNGSYTLTIRATSTTFTVTKTLDITILDGNDPPVMSASPSLEVPENTQLVSTVSATDIDGDTLSYRITGGADKNRFELTSTGSLSFTSPPNFESPKDADSDNRYEVTVMANDGNADSNTLTLQVSVSNVSEAPVFTTQTTEYSIPENSTLITTITAVDPNGGAVVYSLAGVDAARFSCSKGVLRFITAPDFETPANIDNRYHVEVIATNAEGSVSLVLTIEVTDVFSGDLDGISLNGQGFENPIFPGADAVTARAWTGVAETALNMADT